MRFTCFLLWDERAPDSLLALATAYASYMVSPPAILSRVPRSIQSYAARPCSEARLGFLRSRRHGRNLERRTPIRPHWYPVALTLSGASASVVRRDASREAIRMPVAFFLIEIPASRLLRWIHRTRS